MSDFTFRILGPLEVSTQGQRLDIERSRPRALLAVLLLQPGDTVSSARLIDGVWGDRPPASAEQLVRVYVSELRRLLGRERIATRAGGYALSRGDGDSFDHEGFDRLLRRARSAAGDEQLPLYEEALRLVRGPVLADTPLEGAAAVDAARLDELRLSAEEERVDAAMSLGRHRELIPELERLVAAQPLRERLRSQLMLALYRGGRQAEALAAYRETHRFLDEEVGIEPGRELQELQAAILRQDPALDLPAPSPDPTQPQSSTDVPPLATPAPAPGTAQRPRPRRPLAGVAVATSLAAIAAASIALSAAGGAKRPVIRADSLAGINARTSTPLSDVRLSGLPGLVATADGKAWITDVAHHALMSIDLHAPNRPGDTVGISAVPYRLIAGGGALWIADGFDGTITKVELPDGTVLPPFRPEPRSTGRLALAYGDGSLWSAAQDNTLTRLDPENLEPTAVIRDVEHPEAVAVGAGAVWVGQATVASVVRVDPKTNRRIAVPIGGFATSIAASANAVWALTPASNQLWRIDARTDAVTARIEVKPNTSSVLVADDEIWVTSNANGTLTRINANTNAPAQTIQLGHPVNGSTTDGHAIWVTLGA